MKIRTDFVTNSSSSSFTLIIRFNLKNGSKVEFEGSGAGEDGRYDYFGDSVYVEVSPKQLGEAESINELVELLANGVLDGSDEQVKIFAKSMPYNSDGYGDNKEYDAFSFVEKIRKTIKSVDDISSITISGKELYHNGGICTRTYFYSRKSKKYTGTQKGEVEDESNGRIGGTMHLTDLNSCDIQKKS